MALNSAMARGLCMCKILYLHYKLRHSWLAETHNQDQKNLAPGGTCMHSIYFLTKIITYLTATIKAVGHMQREEVSKTQHFHGIGKKKKKSWRSPSKHGEDDFVSKLCLHRCEVSFQCNFSQEWCKRSHFEILTAN